MKVLGWGISDTGTVRDCNEDVFLCDNQLGIYLVSDGAGGIASGRLAAEITRENIFNCLKAMLPEIRQDKTKVEAV